MFFLKRPLMFIVLLSSFAFAQESGLSQEFKQALTAGNYKNALAVYETSVKKGEKLAITSEEAKTYVLVLSFFRQHIASKQQELLSIVEESSRENILKFIFDTAKSDCLYLGIPLILSTVAFIVGNTKNFHRIVHLGLAGMMGVLVATIARGVYFTVTMAAKEFASENSKVKVEKIKEQVAQITSLITYLQTI